MGIDLIHGTEFRASQPAFGEGSKPLAALAKEHAGVIVIANRNLDDPEPAAALFRNDLPLDELNGDLFAHVADVKDWELGPPA